VSINCPSIFDGRARSWGAQPAQSVSSVASRRGSAPAWFFGSGVRRPHPPAVLRQRPVSVARLGGGRSQVQILSPRLRARLAQDGPGGRRPGHKGVRTLGIRALAARRAEARGKRRIGTRSHELSHAGRRDSTLPSSPTVMVVPFSPCLWRRLVSARVSLAGPDAGETRGRHFRGDEMLVRVGEQ
jgi:hypothetical protein